MSVYFSKKDIFKVENQNESRKTLLENVIYFF